MARFSPSFSSCMKAPQQGRSTTTSWAPSQRVRGDRLRQHICGSCPKDSWLPRADLPPTCCCLGWQAPWPVSFHAQEEGWLPAVGLGWAPAFLGAEGGQSFGDVVEGLKVELCAKYAVTHSHMLRIPSFFPQLYICVEVIYGCFGDNVMFYSFCERPTFPVETLQSLNRKRGPLRAQMRPSLAQRCE